MTGSVCNVQQAVSLGTHYGSQSLQTIHWKYIKIFVLHPQQRWTALRTGKQIHKI